MADHHNAPVHDPRNDAVTVRPDAYLDPRAAPPVGPRAAIRGTSGVEGPVSLGVRRLGAMLHGAEQMVYAVTGLMLVVALCLALASAGRLLWGGIADWTGTSATFTIIDRLLFVLMLVEILHTVHASLRSGGLSCEPFLIVGLIACVRRILVITLQLSQTTEGGRWTMAELPFFHASMLELGVLGGLIVVLIGSIRVSRASAASHQDDASLGGGLVGEVPDGRMSGNAPAGTGRATGAVCA